MGLILSASGILSPDREAVREAISCYVTKTGGTFELRAGTTDDRNIGVIQSSASTTTVLYPDGFTDWDDLSRFLSIELKTPVFSFHIHDGDLWMFVAFDGGREVAWFNPIPDCWGEISDAERKQWNGDAESVAALVPGLHPESIERYFVSWTEDVTGADEKSYDDDEFPIGIDWQLTDFMRRLGFMFPIDDSGTPTGETFYLKIRRKQPLSRRPPDSDRPTNRAPPNRGKLKPWWKFW